MSIPGSSDPNCYQVIDFFIVQRRPFHTFGRGQTARAQVPGCWYKAKNILLWKGANQKAGSVSLLWEEYNQATFDV